MTVERSGRHLLFKAFIVAGFLIGIGLLTQTISTYYYVSNSLVLQEAQRDTGRKAMSIERALRAANMSDPVKAGTLIEDSIREWQGLVAWIRIVDGNGKVLLTAGRPVGEPFSTEQIRQSNRDHQTPRSIRESAASKVLVNLYPLRAPGFGQPVMIEVADSLDSISASFASLRRNLIIGVSAAIALLVALIIIGLRFPGYLRGKKLQVQMEMAREVQEALIPKSQLTPNIDVAVECLPASQVGGDVCDVFEVDGGRTAMVLGDVSGKGMGAALLMGLIQGAIHSSNWTASTREHEDACERLNELLCRKTSSDRFASLFWAYYEPEASVLRYVNAGHLPPLLIRRGAGTDLYVQRLDEAGPVMGVLDWGHYRQAEAFVQEGDLLVLFSDGIVEAMNDGNEEFGEHRLLKAIAEAWNGNPAEVRNHVLQQIRSYIGPGREANDDQTLMIVRFQHVFEMAGKTRAVYGSLTNLPA